MSLPHLGASVRAIDLEQPRFHGMPAFGAHGPGYSFVLHRRHGESYDPETRGPRTGASGMLITPEHAGTHIDAISHQAEDLRLHGDRDATAAESMTGFSELGAETIAPIVARGILLDIAATHETDEVPPGTLVDAATLQRCAETAGLTIAAGDVVLVRLGSGRHWRDPPRYLGSAGMAADASEWLADRGVVAVGADNLAWDVLGVRDPTYRCELPGHVVLLVRHGIYILENLALDELAASGHREFTLVCAPLKLVGATGAPVRPLALVPA